MNKMAVFIHPSSLCPHPLKEPRGAPSPAHAPRPWARATASAPNCELRRRRPPTIIYTTKKRATRPTTPATRATHAHAPCPSQRTRVWIATLTVARARLMLVLRVAPRIKPSQGIGGTLGVYNLSYEAAQ